MDGKLKEAVKPCAGNVGTQITVSLTHALVHFRWDLIMNQSYMKHTYRILDIIFSVRQRRCLIWNLQVRLDFFFKIWINWQLSVALSDNK